jgi:hypothetical protein
MGWFFFMTLEKGVVQARISFTKANKNYKAAFVA